MFEISPVLAALCHGMAVALKEHGSDVLVDPRSVFEKVFGGMMENKHNGRGRHLWPASMGHKGFTIVEVLIVVGLIAVMSTFAMMGISSARASMRLAGSTREVAGYVEKARANAIRRNDISIVTIVDANSYKVEMDFGGDGVRDERTFRLQQGVTFTSGSIGTIIQFDWRGKVSSQIGIALTNGREPDKSIHISGSGDITLNSEVFSDTGIGNVNLNSNVNSTVANNNSGS
ncbi:MAG: prepilin-type N-terminal cleavage/methylation domain-containing protein, partial [bacterium]